MRHVYTEKVADCPSLEQGLRAKELLELVHSDVCGPITPTTSDGIKYFVSFICDYSHFCVIYGLRSKNEVFEKFKDYVTNCETKTNKRVRTLSCDQGGEYASEGFKFFCRNKGIDMQYMPRYTPELNAVAERWNWTVVEKAVTMLYDSKLPKELWFQTVKTATYLLNQSPTQALGLKKTPAELWYGTKPNISKLRIFGCTAHVQIPKELRKKFDDYMEKCAIVGYQDTG